LRDFIGDLLRSRDGFDVVGDSGNGAIGLADCLRLKPDLVITDLRLPGMDGVEVAQRLRDALPDIRILLFSGMFNLTIIRRALLAKVDGIVEKGAGLAEMERAIASLVAGKSYLGDVVVRSMPDLVSGRVSLSPVESLTARECEVLRLIAQGLTARDIAAKLGISARTAEVHRNNIMIKLDAHNMVSLTRIAIASGLVDIPS